MEIITTGAADVHPLLTALRRGLPITLLADLIDPNGPRSAEMFEREGATPTTLSAADRIA